MSTHSENLLEQIMFSLMNFYKRQLYLITHMNAMEYESSSTNGI